MKMASRVHALESKDGNVGCGKSHRVICRIGQSKEDALVEYGRDKIGPDDFVIVRHFVTPTAHVERIVQ